MAIHGESMTIVRIIKNNFNEVIIQSFLWKKNWKKTIFLQFVEWHSWNQSYEMLKSKTVYFHRFSFFFIKKNDKKRSSIFLFTKNKSKSRCGITSRNKNRKWCYFNSYRYMNGYALCCVRTFVYILYLFRFFFGAVQIRSSFDATTEMEWRRQRQTNKVKIKIIEMKQRQHVR